MPPDAAGQAPRAAPGSTLRLILLLGLSAFAGAPLGDRWGRVKAELPQPDPARPPWTWPPKGEGPGMSAVYLAVRRVAHSQAALLDEVALTLGNRTPHPDEVQAWAAGLTGYQVRADAAINFETVELP